MDLVATKPTVSVFTLGCKVNLYESRQIISQLLLKGYDAFEGLKTADFFVINTCAVTNEAERKSRQAIARCLKKIHWQKLSYVDAPRKTTEIDFVTKTSYL